MKSILSKWMSTSFLLVLFAYAVNAQNKSGSMIKTKNYVTVQAANAGIKKLQMLVDNTYMVESSYKNVQIFTIKKLSENRFENKYVVHGSEKPYDYKVSLYPEAVLLLEQIGKKHITTIDLSGSKNKIIKNTSVEFRLASIIHWLEKHSWDASNMFSIKRDANQNQVTGFGNDTTKLKESLVSRANRSCDNKKSNLEEVIILPSHSPKAKFYAYCNYNCEQ